MTELQRLLLAYDQHRAAQRPCALATVVDVRGSAYRRPGARMLVTEDGELTGAISGGCLEGETRQRARQCLATGRPALVTYDSTDPDEDLQFGAALGCQGVVEILLEPLDFQDPLNPLALLRTWADDAAAQAPAVVATVFSLAGPDAPALLLLAAGASARLGQPKQLLRCRGQTLLRRAAETAAVAGCRPLLLLTGARHDELLPEVAGLPFGAIHQEAWAEGMGSAIRAGMAALLHKPAFDDPPARPPPCC